MRHFVAYHNTAEMGADPNPLSVVTSKPLAKQIMGDRVWLIAGVGGGPKQYQLTATFIINDCSEIAGDRFEYRVTGQGRVFEPPIPLSDREWFADFLKSQQNFSLGLREITSSPHLGQLVELTEQ